MFKGIFGKSKFFFLPGNGFHWHKRVEGGSIDIDFRYKTALTQGVTFLMFGVSDALVTIDKKDNVTVTY